MAKFLVFAYMAAGFWATGRTIYADSVLIGTWNGIFLQRLIFGTILGWILIPWAIIKLIFF